MPIKSNKAHRFQCSVLHCIRAAGMRKELVLTGRHRDILKSYPLCYPHFDDAQNDAAKFAMRFELVHKPRKMVRYIDEAGE